MTRSLTSDVQAAFAAANVPLLVLVELDFSSGFLRATNASYSVDWNGYSWLGLGRLGRVDVIEEGGSLEAFGVKLTLSGVPAEQVSIALGEHYQGRACRIWAAPLSSEYRVLADPVQCFSGRMDTMQLVMGTQAEITVNAESRLADLERPRVRRYNDADQQAEYPGDLGFQFVEQMVEKQLLWGRA